MIELKGYKHDYEQNFFKDGKKNSVPKKGIRSGQQGNGQKINQGRRRINPVSNKRKEENKLYEKAKREWRSERKSIDGFRCQIEKDGIRCSRRASMHPHHSKRRSGAMLYAKEHFLAVCQKCHMLIHEEVKWARESGYLP